MSESARASRTWLVPVLIYGAALALYWWLGSLQEIPLVHPDELKYGHLARSLAAGEGISWYGVHQTWPMALYIYALTPSWLLASGERAYELAKLTGAISVCLVVFPVWALARRMLRPALAAVPTLLTLVGTWMLTAGGLLTENLAFPLSTAALVCAVLAMREERARWSVAALAFAAAATLARAQMGVLVAVFLGALLLQAAMSENWRAYLEGRRVELIVLGVLVSVGVVVVLSGSASTLGPYTDVADFRPTFDDVLAVAGKQWVVLVTMSGFLPAAAWLAMAADRSAWRDRDIGPLLSIASVSVVVFLLETGYFGAGLPGLGWAIERYVAYAIPLLLVLLVVGIDRRRINPTWLAIAGVAVALSLLAAEEVHEAIEQRATLVTGRLGHDLGLTLSPTLALAAAAVIGLAVLVFRSLTGSRAAYAIGGLLLLVLVLQSQAAWRWQTDFAQQVRAQYPKNLSWVDANAKAPVSRIFLFQNSYLYQEAELFNDEVEQDLAPPRRGTEPPPIGPTCTWTLDATGAIQVAPNCRPVRRRIWNDDAYAQMSFHGGHVLARDDFLGQIIAVPPNPRLRSVIRMPCQRVTLTTRRGSPSGIPKREACPPNMTVFLWVDSPGKLELTFRGGSREQSVSAGSRTWQVPPRRMTRVRLPVQGGASSVTLRTGWDRTVGTQLVSAYFRANGDRAPLL